MPTWLIIAAGALIVASLYFRSRTARVQVLASPKVRLLDLDSGKHSVLLNEDRTWLTRLFADVGECSISEACCDVLFLYGSISADDRCAPSTLAQIITANSAAIVVVATPNPSAAYIAANNSGKRTKSNLVMTLDRKGAAFGNFFEALFADMKRGTSMPVAWVKLAPQGPTPEHDQFPDTIFVCGAGQVAFA